MAHQAPKVGGLAALDPTLHPEIMRQAESLEYTGRGRNIFSQFSVAPEIPKPVAPIREAHVDTGPPPPPPPPPINLGFYGYAAEKTGQKQVFLLHGDDIFIATINGRIAMIQNLTIGQYFLVRKAAFPILVVAAIVVLSLFVIFKLLAMRR